MPPGPDHPLPQADDGLLPAEDRRRVEVHASARDKAPSFPPASKPATSRSRRAPSFGRYRFVLDQDGKPLLLGSGSAAKTYLATHSLLNLPVVLKVIHEALAFDPETRQRFLNEARAIAQLRHPHIAELRDCGEEDGALFCAMEYCDGGDLESLVQAQGPLPPLTALRFCRQAAQALVYVHHQGFLHRDLKPSNLMLSLVSGRNEATLKLIDFGLVKALGQASGLTQQGQFRGTLHYTSPEQLRGDALDERTDVFSLGMTLWYLLEGQLPLASGAQDIARRRLSGLSHAEDLAESMPASLRGLLSQMLQPDPRLRLSDMNAVLVAMDACLGDLGPSHQVASAGHASAPSNPMEWKDALAIPLLPLSDSATKLSSAEAKRETSRSRTSTSKAARLRSMMELQDAAVPSSSVAQSAKASSSSRQRFPGLTIIAASIHTKFELREETEGLHEEIGITYEAKRLRTGDMLKLTVLHDHLARNERFLKQLESLQKRAAECRGGFMVASLALLRFQDHVAFAEEWIEGMRLLTLLKAKQRLSLQEASPVLMQIAEACDLATKADIPSLNLTPHALIMQFPQLYGGRLNDRDARKLINLSLAHWPTHRVRLALDYQPALKAAALHEPVTDDVSELASLPCRYAHLLYHLLSGLPPLAAAQMSRARYVAVPSLSEESNRWLARWISRETMADTCVAILRLLLQMENLPLPPLLRVP